jgi:hypothetical protein
MQYFDNLRKSSNTALNNGSVVSEEGSKYLNFSDINSKIKSNLSLNDDISFTNIKNKISYQQPPTPQKKKRIPFVKNVTPDSNNKNTIKTDLITEKNSSQLNSVISNNL